jgi:hypothetical protein
MSKLFGRRHGDDGNQIVEVPQLDDFARSRGWEQVTDRPFDGRLEDALHHATVSMYVPEHPDTWVRKSTRIDETVFRDVYRTRVVGRAITVANGWTNIQAELRYAADDWAGVAVCAVELPSILPIVCIQPRRYPRAGSDDSQPSPSGESRRPCAIPRPRRMCAVSEPSTGAPPSQPVSVRPKRARRAQPVAGPTSASTYVS